MDNKTFRDQVETNLENFDREQIVFFAWLCAVRVLPFIGSHSDRQKYYFNYWKDDARQRYLYALFRALDANNYFSASDTDDNICSVADAAYAAADAADDTTAATAAAAVAAAARAATRADADDARADARVAANAARINIDLQNTILQDMLMIEKNGKTTFLEKEKTFNNNLNLYGKIWDNFQHALKKEGCTYWADLYEDIFESNFNLDKEALERRMNVPKEIQEQGANAVADYLVEMEEKGATYLNEARIIILGEKGAGKTCLARRLINPNADMTTDEESTAGVNTLHWELDDINIHIWDFAGHTVTHAVHQFFLSERCLYILVYDGRTEERNRLEYWLNQMKNYGDKSKVYILINKRDPHPPVIPINSLKDNYPIIDCFTLSIKDDKDKLVDFRKKIAGYIKNNPSWSNQLIATSYFNVKKELEQHFKNSKKEEYIDITKFNKIAKKNKVDDPDKLLKHLHDLGVCLHYNIEDFDTLVLNPEWISQGIYKIINWVHKEDKYSISDIDFPTVFKDEADRYPVSKHPFLFNLMKRYELAYETEKKGLLIIPHLLHEDRPEILPDFPVGESLMLRYKAEQSLPPNTISRFIVRHNEELKGFLVWRDGVVLESGNGSIALVRESKEERMITVSVRGNNKTAYLDKLRETLNNIFYSYKSKKPELQYRIERFGQLPDEIEKNNPLWLSDSKIYNHHIDNRPYYDDYSRRDISMHSIIQKFNITTDTFIMGGQGHRINRSVNTFNFHNCNIDLQANLNDLAGTLKRKGETEEAVALENAAKALSEVEEYTKPEEVKKKGIVNILKRIVDEFADENSKLHKTVKGIKTGIGIAQDIAKGYNKIAQWVGFPQVPEPFLKKE